MKKIIQEYGRKLFGKEWLGEKNKTTTYLINRALLNK